jgi:hypothetical protein
MVDRIAGYHFDMAFGVTFQALAPFLVERAGVAGIKVSGPGYELQPRTSMLRVVGTRWAGLRTGDLQFQVLEMRMDLDGWLIQEPNATSRQDPYPFGVREEPKGWISPHLNKAVGLWLRGGSLVLCAFQGDKCSFDDAVLVEFDMWQALDALVELAKGEPSFGAPLPEPVRPARGAAYAAPAWAKDFTMTARTETGKATASFNNPRYIIAGGVTLMERAV